MVAVVDSSPPLGHQHRCNGGNESKGKWGGGVTGVGVGGVGIVVVLTGVCAAGASASLLAHLLYSVLGLVSAWSSYHWCCAGGVGALVVDPLAFMLELACSLYPVVLVLTGSVFDVLACSLLDLMALALASASGVMLVCSWSSAHGGPFVVGLDGVGTGVVLVLALAMSHSLMYLLCVCWCCPIHRGACLSLGAFVPSLGLPLFVCW